MRSELKGFGTTAPEILSEICENTTYANLTHARFTVHGTKYIHDLHTQIFVKIHNVESQTFHAKS